MLQIGEPPEPIIMCNCRQPVPDQPNPVGDVWCQRCDGYLYNQERREGPFCECTVPFEGCHIYCLKCGKILRSERDSE